jgi:diadenosine tetraphosphate (Ap4A) HIT family hydrolase
VKEESTEFSVITAVETNCEMLSACTGKIINCNFFDISSIRLRHVLILPKGSYLFDTNPDEKNDLSLTLYSMQNVFQTLSRSQQWKNC